MSFQEFCKARCFVVWKSLILNAGQIPDALDGIQMEHHSMPFPEPASPELFLCSEGFLLENLDRASLVDCNFVPSDLGVSFRQLAKAGHERAKADETPILCIVGRDDFYAIRTSICLGREGPCFVPRSPNVDRL